MGQASPRYTAEFKKKTVDLYNSKENYLRGGCDGSGDRPWHPV